MKKSTTLAAALLFLCASGCTKQTPAPASAVTISLNTAETGAAIPADYTGLSFEGSLLMPDKETGLRTFRPDNKPLLQLFQTLNVKSLRVGGNTSDRDATAMPSEADIDSLFAFAKASNTKVIYCLRLYKSTPEEAAKTAKYIMDKYADLMDCFAIGQEPSAYPKPPKTGEQSTAKVGMGEGFENNPYAAYAANWKKFAAAVLAAAPNAKFCGPAVHNNGTWAKNFMRDFAKTHPIVLIVEHLYPGGAGGKVPSPEVGISRMLSSDFVKAYQKLHDSFVPETLANKLPYRLEEVNNYFNGGAVEVSNTFASALWGLDFMWWWATHDAAGLNFHTGDKVAAGPNLLPSKYTAYVSAPDGYYVRPLGYGIKAFDLAARGGKLVPATVTNTDNLNLSVYATQKENGDLAITIINKEHNAGARDADLTINLKGANYKTAKTMSLAAPNNDITAKAGITLGGVAIKNDGTWTGASWAPAPAITDGALRLKIPAASATVLLCTR